jgi:hypothetical protein
LSRPSRALKIKRKRMKIPMMKISRPRSEGNWRAYNPAKTKLVNSSPCRWICHVVSLILFKNANLFIHSVPEMFIGANPDSNIHAS